MKDRKEKYSEAEERTQCSGQTGNAEEKSKKIIDMDKVVFETVIGLDTDAIIKDGIYYVDTIIKTIVDEFRNKGMIWVKSECESELTFVTEDNNKFALMGAAMIRCYRSPIKPYFKKIMFYNYEAKTKSDYLQGLIRENF